MTGFTNALLSPVTVSGGGGTNDVESDWGAVGDGSTNDRTAINNAFAWLVAVPDRILTFGTSKTYVVGTAAATPSVTITGGNTWKIVGNGSTIKAATSSLATNGQYTLKIDGSSNFVVDGLTVDGNRAGRTVGSTNGSNILLVGANTNGSFISCTSKNAPNEDNWYMSATNSTSLVHTAFPSNILFYLCTGDFARRNNMSLIQGRNIQVLGGFFQLANGENPEGGIDCEPNAGPADDGLGILDQVLIRGVTFDGNEATPITFARFVQNSTIEGNLFIGRVGVTPNTSYDKASGIYMDAQNHVIVQSNWFKNFGSNYVTVDDIIRVQSGFAEGMRDITIQNNFFHNCQSGLATIYEHSASGPGPINFIGNEFYNCIPATTIAINAPSWTTSSGNNVVGSPTTPSPTIPWDVTGGGGGATLPVSFDALPLGSAAGAVSGSTSTIITTSADAPAGSHIVVGFCCTANGDDVSGYNCTDSNGNVYSKAVATFTYDIMDQVTFYTTDRIPGTLETGSTITVSWGDASGRSPAAAACIIGLEDDPLDQINHSSGSSTTPSSGSVTVSTAPQCFVGVSSDRGPVGDSFTSDTEFDQISVVRNGTADAGATNNGTVTLDIRAVANTETNSYAPTLGTSRPWGASIATFRIALTAPTPDPIVHLFRPTGFNGGFQ